MSITTTLTIVVNPNIRTNLLCGLTNCAGATLAPLPYLLPTTALSVPGASFVILRHTTYNIYASGRAVLGDTETATLTIKLFNS